MDPISAVTAVSNASKLVLPILNLGHKAWQLFEPLRGGEPALKAMQELFEHRIGIAAVYPQALSPKAGARHLELLLLAFGQAFRRHWADWDRYAQALRHARWHDIFHKDRDERERQRQVEAALRGALMGPPEQIVDPLDQRDEVLFYDGLLGTPLASPFYRSLWQAFTVPVPNVEEEFSEPLLVMEGEARDRFERAFCQGFEEALETDVGRELRAALLALAKDKPKEIRRLLVRDMASWGRRHVFGNVANHQGLPAMPLADMYVEPQARLRATERSTEAPREPVRSLIRRLLQKHPIVVVAADFGHGKSLTARSLTRDWASEFLEGSAPSTELLVPVFVRCAEDVRSSSLALDLVVRNAQRRHCQLLGLELKSKDQAFVMPDPSHRAVFLLDGLDEVSLSHGDLRQLFNGLRDETSEEHRVVVFSRPAALPDREYLQKYDIPVVELAAFDESQVADWLGRWSRLCGRAHISAGDLAARGFTELAQTPILLFMIAHTWAEQATAAEGRVAIYERFFQQIAKGKAEQDIEENPHIKESSRLLRESLSKRGWIDPEVTQVEAMLWLLARIAWASHSRERQGKPLRDLDIRYILDKELGLEDEGLARSVYIGLLLALQADPVGGEQRILFGHQSFREFLVARLWAKVLERRLAGMLSQDALRDLLMEERLLGGEDRSFEFFKQMVATWPLERREALLEWASMVFNDEELGAKTLLEDRRYVLRESALAIGSICVAERGVKARHPLTLRSLLANFWVNHSNSEVRAPKANLSGANLSGADLEMANLSGANLSGANLERADLEGADLERANLSGAILSGTNLYRTLLYRANLSRANLSFADLSRANLSRANLSRANLRKANLEGAKLSGAKLSGANLREANLQGANLQGADLEGAKLNGAHIQEVRGLTPDKLVELQQRAAVPNELQQKLLPEDEEA